MGRPGVLHGAYTYVLQDATDRSRPHIRSRPASIILRSARSTRGCAISGRAEYTYADDREALAAFQTLAKTEGILPALESAHAIAEVIKRAPSLHSDQVLLVNLSGRGDKDLDTVTQALAEQEVE